MADIGPKFTHLPRHHDAPLGQYVYFMYSVGRIKIGYSRDPYSRQRALAQQQVPFPPVIVLVINGTIDDEQALHVRFYADRAYGEWFFLSPAIRDYLKARLCDAGRATLEKAEADFYEHCREIVENYRAPPKNRKPRQVCEHGMPVSGICPPCERERDLAIVERIKKGECHICGKPKAGAGDEHCSFPHGMVPDEAVDADHPEGMWTWKLPESL